MQGRETVGRKLKQSPKLATILTLQQFPLRAQGDPLTVYGSLSLRARCEANR